VLLKKFLGAAAAAALVSVSLNASASVANGTFTVTLVVNKTCTVTTSGASNITLGPVNAGAATTIQSGAFGVECSNGTAFSIGLAPSNANTAGAGVLTGVAHGQTIAYQLYQNAAGTTIWGNTAGVGTQGNGPAISSGTGVATPVPFTVYANATGSTNVDPDTYTDTVTINVNF
jgi:spore coat protein U-like protein